MESFVNDKDFDLLAQDQYTFAVLDRILRGRCDLVRTNHQDLCKRQGLFYMPPEATICDLRQ